MKIKNYPNKKRIRYIIIPKILWWCGGGLVDNFRSFLHLVVFKKEPYWKDASQEDCKRLWCRYCGKSESIEKIFVWYLLPIFIFTVVGFAMVVAYTNSLY